MRTPAKTLLAVVLATGLFGAGYVANRQTSVPIPAGAAKQAGSYTCPMHPQYVSDHPGDCPICGMRLEPVAIGKSDPSAGGAAGMLVLNAATQQRVGLRADVVRRDATSQVLRVPGRIAVDDQRLYRLIAAVDGWIVDLRDNTSGRFVKKDQLLGSYYTPNLQYNERLFLLSVPANEPLNAQAKDFSQASIRTAGSANPQFPIDSLRGLGMSDLQIEEIHRTRMASPHVNLYSPVNGFVIARDVSPGQRFDKGTELYRIADLSRVWVMTDVFEKDRQFLKPGAEASVVYQGRRLDARMADALPQFDPQSRTLKTRFELDNPGYVLQPDMFVDVELHVQMPPAITVPADAVFDSGLRKTVFVDHGSGRFEARRVQTGWRLGDRIEVVRGLMEGERVVAAANFLLDSESRMREASAGIFNPETDLVCGMEVDAKKAVAAGRTAVHEGRTYYFCSDGCKKKFEAEPGKYMEGGLASPKPTGEGGGRKAEGGHSHEQPPVAAKAPMKTMAPAAATPTHAAGEAMKPMSATQPAAAQPASAKDLVCGMDVDPKDREVAARKIEYNGKAYYFCSDDCKAKFKANPAAYVKAGGGGR